MNRLNRGVFAACITAAFAGSPVLAETCDYKSLDSVPGKTWSEDYGWRYDTSEDPDPEKRADANRENREKAYATLVDDTSPWPDWFEPDVSVLPVGTLFQMAMSNGQGDDQLGGFGTFDAIHTVTDVREDLAVLQKWKPDIDRVNRYRVVEVMPVHVGPIGPQVDPDLCELLPGRFSQFEMLVPRDSRSHYVEFVSSHPIEQK